MYRFNEYRVAVLRDYEERKAANGLSHELNYPTANNLRDEAVKACQTRFKRSDENVLESFFKRHGDGAEYARVIGKKEDVNCFRALRNFLNGETADPAEKQVELLAWLTDFKPRPYQEYIKTYPVPIEMAGTKPTTTQSPGDSGHRGEDTMKKEEIKRDKLIYSGYTIWLSVSLFLVVGLFVIYQYVIKEKCIRWDGRQYEVVACDAFPGDPSVIPYDPVKLKDFKMVLRYDTLTTYSIKKVWYSKRKDEYEFFTAGGVHPVYRDLQLKPLTDYILNTVVRKKRNQLLLPSEMHP
ncbi:MAG: hypothetical protein JWR38_5291 [Mucilaginibacter sp.]|nr:hypothetical protein [Mucilaginibacter sp.]